MNRRNFFKRVTKAAFSFSVAPGVFRALPSAKRVEAVIVRPTAAYQKAFVDSFFFGKHEPLEYVMPKIVSLFEDFESGFKKDFGVGPFDKWPNERFPLR